MQLVKINKVVVIIEERFDIAGSSKKLLKNGTYFVAVGNNFNNLILVYKENKFHFHLQQTKKKQSNVICNKYMQAVSARQFFRTLWSSGQNRNLKIKHYI